MSIKVNSKDYEYLVERLEEEIDKVYDYSRNQFEKGDIEKYEVAKTAISHHEEMIRFIKKIDKENVN